jgi:ABC-type nitrate/sulfonate/bicarbonate transport system permease component
MSVVNEVHAGALAVANPPTAAQQAKVPFWRWPRLYRYGFLAFILIVWQLVGPMINPIFFSYPTKIAVAFYNLTFVTGELQHYMVESLLILFYGLGIAILVGVPLAILMARFKPVDWALDLPVNAMYATPMVALVPVLVLWFGIYMEAKVIVVFLFCVFPVLINTYQGVRECDKNMLEVARSFRSNEWRMWRDVLFPFALPYIAAGVRLAIGRGLVGVVIAEFYTTISGLGYMITRYAHIFDMDKTFVPIILLMFLGVSLTSGLKWLERRIAPWSRADH